MRVSFTRTGHLLSPLGTPEDNYLISVSKIPCSSLIIVTDAHLKRLYLYDMHRPYITIPDEVAGYHRSDLSIASVSLLDEGDGVDAICGDVCVDDVGYYIYALIVVPDKSYIKVFRHLNRKLYYTGLQHSLPMDLEPLTFEMDTLRDVTSLDLGGHIGLPILHNQLFYGTGLAYYKGKLFVLTRRRVFVEMVSRVRYNVVINPQKLKLKESETTPTYTPGTERPRGGNELHKERLYEKRIADVYFSLLTVMSAETGQQLSQHYLTIPGTTNDSTKDCVFHGLSLYDGQLFAGVREDKHILPSDLSQWSVAEAKHSSTLPDYRWIVWSPPDKAGYTGELSYHINGFLKHEWSLALNGDSVAVSGTKFASDNRELCADAIVQLQKRLKTIANTELPTPVFQTRGPTRLVALPLDDVVKTPLELQTSVVTQDFPFGVALPYSLAHDQAERKMYGVFGNQLWVFDMLDYTLLVSYADAQSLFEGDIIDLGNVMDATRREVQCFIRNDAMFTLMDTTLMIDLTDEPDVRAEDIFLTLPGVGSTGYKELKLGDIPPGQSREFWVKIYSLDVKFYEDGTTHTIPLRVEYTSDDDDM